MKVNATFGVVLELGEYTLVYAANSGVAVPYPSEFKVKIAPGLAEQGVKTLQNGKIKVPNKGTFVLIIVVDKTFSEVRVIPQSQELITAAITSQRTAFDLFYDRIMKIIEKAGPKSELTKAVAYLTFDDFVKTVKQLGEYIKAAIADIDSNKLITEIVQLAKEVGVTSPAAPETED